MQQHLVLVVFVVSKYWVGRKIISMYQENMYKGYTPMATMSFVPQYIHSFKCKSLQKLHNKFPQSSTVQLFQIVWLAGIDESSMYIHVSVRGSTVIFQTVLFSSSSHYNLLPCYKNCTKQICTAAQLVLVACCCFII